MQNTKIIKLLRTLNQYEIKSFKDLVHSPLYNKNEKIIKLFEEIKKFYPKFDSEELTDEFIFMNVLPEEEYDYHKLKNILSDLFLLGKEFLSFIHFRKNEINKNRYLLEELRVRGLDTIFEQTFKSAEKLIEELKVKDENYLYHKMNLTEELISYITPKKPNENIHKQQEKLNLFLKFSVIRFLKFYNIMMHEEKQNNIKYDMGMFDEIINYIEKNSTEDNPTLLVYYNIILLEKKKEDKYFYALKELKKKYENELNEFDRYMIFLHMMGYCANIYNADSRADFFHEQFELVKEKQNIFDDTIGKLLYPDFLNEVKVAVRVNEFDWAEDYIEKNKFRLTDEKESTLNFCYGYINYKRGNPELALDLFCKTYFPNFIIKLQVKLFQLQIYYDMEFYEQAFSMIDSFRHYLKREKTIKEDFKESFYEYLRNTNELIKIKSGNYKNDEQFHLDKIRDDIKAMKNNQFGIKIWLEEKLNLLR